MEPPPDPPRLEYATPEEKPVTPTHPVVGVLGFLLYGIIFLFLSLGVAALVRDLSRRNGGDFLLSPMAIVGGLWCLALWRCVAALSGALRRPRKRRD